MVKLTYYGLGDAMIPEMCQEYKEKMCDKNHTYRVCRKMCHELTDIFREEEWISEPFGTYLMGLEQLMKAHSEEIFMLWKLFCCAEEYCGLYEARKKKTASIRCSGWMPFL